MRDQANGRMPQIHIALVRLSRSWKGRKYAQIGSADSESLHGGCCSLVSVSPIFCTGTPHC